MQREYTLSFWRLTDRVSTDQVPSGTIVPVITTTSQRVDYLPNSFIPSACVFLILNNLSNRVIAKTS